MENYEAERDGYIKINLITTDFDEGLTETTEKATDIKISDLLNIMFDDSATESVSKRTTNNASERYALAESKHAHTEVMVEKRRSEPSLKI